MSDNEHPIVSEVKPEAGQNPEQSTGGDSDSISIKVTDGNTDVTFKVKYKTSLNRVMDAFCKRIGKDRASLRFLFDGERVSDDDTPSTLGMEDMDKIEALNQQTGGA